MTDCSSIQGSTSSSSDVMTLTTAASSWCAIPTNSRIRVLRLVRPHHTRRMLMITGPESNPSYGFAVRGGKEFGTGFFVSQVERNSEAELKGLRIGDQILRLNGFRVEDAVHKEFIRFVSSQDRITLKVRGVGMLPIKDIESDRLSWNVVKMPSISNTPSESSFKTVNTENSSTCSAIGVGDLRCKEISVVLDVAPRTKLGLGICKGPEWKPGIFVQFTKEKSVARESGLRPGDQILSVNSIDFSDVLFSEAVAVMKSSNKLEMIVRTAAGCDLFPGESSGYNSSASSVTGDQSPCWADAKSKRLTAVREEPTIAACWNDALYAEQQSCNGKLQQNKDIKNTTKLTEVNKTIIKLSGNGTSINNTYVANTHQVNSLMGAPQKISNVGHKENIYSKTKFNETPPPTSSSSSPSTMGLYSNIEQPGRSRPMQHQSSDIARGNNSKDFTADVHRKKQQLTEEKHNQMNISTLQRNTLKTITTSQTPTTAVPKPPPPALSNNNSNSKCSNNNQSTLRSNNINGIDAAGSTLSSAITEELKKRREKQRNSNITNNADIITNNNSNNSNNNDNTFKSTSCNSRTEQQQTKTPMTTSTVTTQRHQQHQHQHNQHYHHHSAQHQQPYQEHQQQTAITSPTKRAPSISNGTNCADRNSNICGNTKGAANIDQHSALMDEFKRAHQRMFKNGFQESERKERQEALNHMPIMDDDSSHRTSRHFPNGKSSSVIENTKLEQQVQNVPPPPPQFANSPPKNQTNQIQGVPYQPIKRENGTTKAATSNNSQQPPNSPTPDYDNVDFRQGKQLATYGVNGIIKKNSSNTISNGIPNTNRRGATRLGAITIGEYEPHRKEPSKFEFVEHKRRESLNDHNIPRNIDNLHNELHDTLSRSKLKNGNHLEHQRDCPLRNGNGIDHLTRKMQTVNLNRKPAQNNEGSATIKRQNSSTVNGTGSSTGILKNGNSRNNNNNGIIGQSSKMVEKTITFGN